MHEALDVPRIRWEQWPVPLSAEDLLRARDGRLDAPARDEAEAVLREILSDGPKDAKEVMRDAGLAGITPATLKRAKRRLGVIAARRWDARGRIEGWTWSLPAPDVLETAGDDVTRGSYTNLDPPGSCGDQGLPEAHGFGVAPLETRPPTYLTQIADAVACMTYDDGWLSDPGKPWPKREALP